MAGQKSLFLVFSLVLLSPFTGAASPQMVDADEESHGQDTTHGNVWKTLSQPLHSFFQISEPSGMIHSPLGSFDPLVETLPEGPWEKSGLDSHSEGGMFLVQSRTRDLDGLDRSLTSIGVAVIDHIPDETLVIEVKDLHREETLAQIAKLPSVRWLGGMPTMWKVSPSLYPLISVAELRVDLEIILSSDLLESEHTSLSTHLARLSDDDQFMFHCDSHLCQLRSIEPHTIPLLASDSRVLKIEPGPFLSIHNSNASLVAGLLDALSASGGLLTGIGEVVGISDTGLDADHIDFQGRLRSPVYNQFGPDNSGADTNSGHGTHVTATLLGDGSGDSNATGMVPEATFHFYQLEVDSSGLLARWGSLYEMFQHSWQNDANIQTNSWGSLNLVGHYTSDSRSADSFAYDYPDFLILFSAGDSGTLGVSSPSTAKNVLSVGATTTGSYGSEPMGEVAPFSSNGPTEDGRIKPDLVAPGVMLCSARAQEAALASGGECSDATHADGSTPQYMTLNGSSMATPVVAGAAAMARQYLREEAGVPNPRSDLLRAILVNGADDLGAPNIPNSLEGWGQLNLSNSLYPKTGNENLSVFFDDDRQLFPGHSFIYTFEMSSGLGFDATLAWNDREGSASADQNASRLISDLDLIITSPDGSVYKGNHFIDGFSAPDGNKDQLNNIERVKLGSTQSGIWMVQIGHSGGFTQDYAFVLSAIAEETQEADLTVIQNSIFSPDIDPLQGDTISIQLSWANQAAAQSGQYSIQLEDLSDGSIIRTDSMPSLGGGAVESFTLYHSFATTGQHILRLTLDYLSEVDELNDEISGTNNNVFELSYEVTQIGVRVTPLMEDGSFPSGFEETTQAHFRNLDPSTASWALFDLELRNEGTSEITVDLTISPIQIVDDSGILNPPQDEWWRLLNESGPWTLSPSGESGDRVVVTLNLSDQDADISDTSEARFALPGTFVTDLTLYDTMAPTISHSIRLSVDVARVEGLYTVSAGSEGLGAEPGEFALFTVSVKNIGNGPTQYNISCDTPNRWLVNVGNSQSSMITIGPLSRLQFVPVPIRIRVPLASQGLSAGETESLTCAITSVNDPSLESIEETIVEVFESREFSTEIFDSEGTALGEIALSQPRAVLNGDYVSTHLLLENKGNIPLEFDVKALSSSNSWPIQMYLSNEQPPTTEVGSVTILLNPGEVSEIVIRTIVPLSAEKGDRNTISIKTILDGNTVSNGTQLEVKEVTTLDIESSAGFTIALGSQGNTELNLHNSGNVPLVIELTLGTLPQGWSGGFLSGRQFSMEMNRDSTVSLALELPGEVDSGHLQDSFPVIIESTSPSGGKQVHTVELSVTVLPSVWITLLSETNQIQDIEIGDEASFTVVVSNLGNEVTGVNMGYAGLDGWEVSIDPLSFENIEVGESVDVTVAIRPTKSSEDGLREIRIFANSSQPSDIEFITDSEITMEVSKSRSSNKGGVAGILGTLGMPAWTIAILFIFTLAGLVALGVLARQANQPIREDDELIPRGSALQAGDKAERRAAALDTSIPGDVITGGVSNNEIEQALASTLPKLPTHDVPEGAPPLPLSGLPEGWTMEQWAAYGNIWWEQNGP